MANRLFIWVLVFFCFALFLRKRVQNEYFSAFGFFVSLANVVLDHPFIEHPGEGSSLVQVSMDAINS